MAGKQKQTVNELLGLAVKHWLNIENGLEVDDGKKTCIMCQNFECYECPAEKVHGTGCGGTPYDEWDDHQYFDHKVNRHRKVLCPKCERLARKQRKYIQSLIEDHNDQTGI
jgi:hypothetical protein